MVRVLASVPVLLGFALPALADEPDVTQKGDLIQQEKLALRGYWAPQRYEQGLTLTEDTGFGEFTAEIDDKVWVNSYGPGRLWAWRYSIDPTANPKRIDFVGRQEVGPDGPLEQYVRLGIYKIEGDTLTLCFSAVVPVESGHRPNDFSAGPGSGRIMTVFTRSTAPNDDSSPAEAAAPLRPRLQGPSRIFAPSSAAPSPATPTTAAVPITTSPAFSPFLVLPAVPAAAPCVLPLEARHPAPP